MIIERAVEPVLHRQKCSACGYYTIYRAVPTGERATDTCTHCDHQVAIPWHQDIKSLFKSSERFLKDLEEIFPELQGLKNPGDHILFD
jgi:hypothetical protein